MQYNTSMVWGPLTVPGRFTRSNVRVLTDNALYGIKVWLLSASNYTAYANGSVFQVADNGVVSTGAQRIANVTDLIIGTYYTNGETSAYLVFEHSPRTPGPVQPGFVAPMPALQVVWDDLQWVSGRFVHELPGDQACGRRNMNSGAGQYSFAPLVKTSSGSIVCSTRTVSRGGNGVAVVSIVTKEGLANVQAGVPNSAQGGQACFQNNVCTVPAFNASRAPYYMVLQATGGGSVLFDYILNEGALSNMCINATATVSDDSTAVTSTASGTSTAGAVAPTNIVTSGNLQSTNAMSATPETSAAASVTIAVASALLAMAQIAY